MPSRSRPAGEGVSWERRDTPTEGLALGGALGWALGLAGGAAVGYAVQPDAGESYFGAAEWWLGAWVGSSLGSATGVHLVNRGQGVLALSALGALVSVPVSLFVAVPLAEFGGVGLLIVPAAQIATSVLIERLTSRRRAR